MSRDAADEYVDPVDELSGVLTEALNANALRLASSRGGYVGGGQPHATLGNDAGAVEAMARALLARKVAEPSRSLAPAASETSLDGLPTADELARALTECAPARPGIYAEAEAILHELRKNRTQGGRDEAHVFVGDECGNCGATRTDENYQYPERFPCPTPPDPPT